MAPSNWTLKYLPLALFGTVKCLRYQAMPKKGRPPSCGLNLRSNGPSMAQSWGRSSVRHAASLKADCSAPAASPLKKRQSSVRRMRRSAPILISVEAAAVRPAKPSSDNVAAEQEREKFRIFDSKNQISAFRARGVTRARINQFNFGKSRSGCLWPSANMGSCLAPLPVQWFAHFASAPPVPRLFGDSWTLGDALQVREPRNVWGTARAQPPKYVKHHFHGTERLRDASRLSFPDAGRRKAQYAWPVRRESLLLPGQQLPRRSPRPKATSGPMAKCHRGASESKGRRQAPRRDRRRSRPPPSPGSRGQPGAQCARVPRRAPSGCRFHDVFELWHTPAVHRSPRPPAARQSRLRPRPGSPSAALPRCCHPLLQPACGFQETRRRDQSMPGLFERVEKPTAGGRGYARSAQRHSMPSPRCRRWERLVPEASGIWRRSPRRRSRRRRLQRASLRYRTVDRWDSNSGKSAGRTLDLLPPSSEAAACPMRRPPQPERAPPECASPWCRNTRGRPH